MKCLICGRDYKNVTLHANKLHGVDKREYKTRFDIPMETAVWDAETLANAQKNGKQQHQDDPMRMVRAHAAQPPGWQRKCSYKYTEKHKERLRAAIEANAQRVHAEALLKWEGRRDEFTKMWIAGVPAAEMNRYFCCSSHTRIKYRKLFGLEPRYVFIDGARYERP